MIKILFFLIPLNVFATDVSHCDLNAEAQIYLSSKNNWILDIDSCRITLPMLQKVNNSFFLKLPSLDFLPFGESGNFGIFHFSSNLEPLFWGERTFDESNFFDTLWSFWLDHGEFLLFDYVLKDKSLFLKRKSD